MRLCAIHTHVRHVNTVRLRIGKQPIRYQWMAERYPARRDRLLSYWTRLDRHAHKALHAYLAAMSSPEQVGQQLAAEHGWTGGEWDALHTLWQYESGWDAWAVNPSSGACSIPQFLPCRYLGDVRGSILAGIAYIEGRYGVPSAALAHFYAYGWY